MSRRKNTTQIDQVRDLLNAKSYQAAKSCIEEAMQLHPDLEYAFEASIVCNTLYYGNTDLPNFGIDWYSLLHLHPSATESEVKSQSIELVKHIASLAHMSFTCITVAVRLIQQAICVLCSKPKRSEFDQKRIQSGVVDFPVETNNKGTFRERYLGWKPPTPIVSNDSPVNPITPNKKLKVTVDADEVFDEMPQRVKKNIQLDKYTLLGLNVAFNNLCEEIQTLDDPQCFLSRLDGFRKQTMELEEVGFNVVNVEKVKERLEILEQIAGYGRACQEEAEKLEAEIKERKKKVAKLKDEIQKRNSDFVSIAKSNLK